MWEGSSGQHRREQGLYHKRGVTIVSADAEGDCLTVFVLKSDH